MPGPIAASVGMPPPPGMPNWGAPYREFIAKYFARHAALNAQTDNLPFADQMIDLDPNVRDACGLAGAAPDLRLAAAERAGARRIHAAQDRGDRTRHGRVARLAGQRTPGLAGWTPSGRRPHGQRSRRTSVVNRYGQSWDIPNLFIAGGSIHPTISGFNPTLTMQALAYMTADAIVSRYQKNPGPLL